MATFHAIAEVSEILRRALDAAVQPIGAACAVHDLALMLRYLITAWSGNIVDDQTILGRAVQTLYEQAIVAGSELAGTSLVDRDEAIAVTMIPQSIEDRTHVWRAYDKPYRLSINCEVRVVKIESSRPARVRPQVKSRHLVHGVVEEVA